MKNTEPTPKDFSLHKEGVRYVIPTAELTIFVNKPLSKLRTQVLAAQKLFLQWCPKEELRFYATENMKQFKPVTTQTTKLLDTWFKPGSKLRNVMGLTIKNGDEPRDAPSWKFEVHGEENEQGKFSEWSNMIAMAFPVDWVLENPEEFANRVRAVATLFPYQSGQAGFCFQCTRFAEETSFTHAWKQSIKHPGMNIDLGAVDNCIATSRTSLKTINWITLLGPEEIKKIGGEKKLQSSLGKTCQISKCGTGFLIQAGNRPVIDAKDDAKIFAGYKAAYAACKPLITSTKEPALYMPLDGNRETKTLQWFKRFEKK